METSLAWRLWLLMRATNSELAIRQQSETMDLNFTIAHELRHYFLDGHPEAIFSSGNDRHYSRSGFVSDDKHEKEADAFAAELLMPEKFFKEALRKCGAGFAGIQYLADLGRTSLVATAIRFVRITGDPVAVILSSGNEIDWCFVSKELLQCRGVYILAKKTILPQRSVLRNSIAICRG